MTNAIVTAIVRCAGERTEAACRQLVEAQAGGDRVTEAREVPFSRTLARSFELGIDQGARWTLCVDADVLLRPDALTNLIELAERQPENVYLIQPMVLDRFFGGPRLAGVHLYRTSALGQAKGLIPEEGVDIRPESHVRRQMVARGWARAVVDYVAGLHDFEQALCDVYRKAMVQAHKHVDRLSVLVNYWRRMAEDDVEFSVALQGLGDGVAHVGALFIDRSKYAERLGECRLIDSVEERPALGATQVSEAWVEQVITSWLPTEDYRKACPEDFERLFPPSSPPTYRARTVAMRHNLGVVRFAGWVGARAIERAGARMRKRFERVNGELSK